MKYSRALCPKALPAWSLELLVDVLAHLRDGDRFHVGVSGTVTASVDKDALDIFPIGSNRWHHTGLRNGGRLIGRGRRVAPGREDSLGSSSTLRIYDG